MDNEIKVLVKKAVAAKEKAYAKYSNFRVGAVLITDEDEEYIGANVENSAYGLTICAERTAAFTAIVDGKKKFKRIVIASDADEYISPCGSCRQVMMELCGPELEVIMVDAKEEYKSVKLKELLPYSFNEEFLK